MALKFIKELPKGATKPKGTRSVFADDLADELRSTENAGKWALIENGTGQGAAAWLRRLKEAGIQGFEYASVDTGEANGPKRKAPNGKGEYQPTKKEIYVRFNPDLA